MKIKARTVLIAFCMLLLGNLGQSQNLESESSGLYPDVHGIWPSRFGQAVDVCDDWLAVGVPDAINSETLPIVTFRGEVRMFKKSPSGWELKQTLRNHDGWLYGAFGMNLILEDGFLLVGEPDYGVVLLDPNLQRRIGRAHTFELVGDRWVHGQQIRGVSPWGPTNYFGWQMDVDGDWMVFGQAGEWTQPSPGDVPGAFHVYHRSPDGTWVQTQRELAPLHSQVPSTDYGMFGQRVKLQGDLLLISAFNTGGGSVFAYRLNGSQWILEKQFPDPLPHWSSAQFDYGRDLAIDGDRIAISAVSNDYSGLHPFNDFVHFFEHDNGTWNDRGFLYAPGPGQTPDKYPRFGASLEMDGEWLFVGAPGGQEFEGATLVTNIGRCNLFKRDDQWNWGLVEEYRHSNRDTSLGTVTGAYLGEDVAADFDSGVLVSGATNFVAVGPSGLGANEWVRGAVFTFDVENGATVCSGSLNSTGDEGKLSVMGSPVVGEANLWLHGNHLPPDEFALCLYGQTSVPIPVLTGGSLCVLGGGVTRLFPATRIGVTGEIFHEVNFQNPLNSMHLQQGTTWSFQVWHRDFVGGTSSTGTTESVEVLLE